MLDDARERAVALLVRLRRLERRELGAFVRWVEHTRNLLHLSILLFVPLLIFVVTGLSNAVPDLSYLLFPPLASGTYTLFADPEGRYASPLKFVAGLTVGAVCGAVAVWATAWLSLSAAGQNVSPTGAALSVLLVGMATWLLDIEEPAAFSTALLGLFTGAESGAYVLSIAASSALVAVVFTVWRRQFYERRARYLYASTKGDDHVLVPMRGPETGATAMLGARLAAAHDAGKVVLLDLVDERSVADQGTTATDGGRPEHQGADASDADEATARAGAEAARSLEEQAGVIETRVGVPCEVMVATEGTDAARTTLDAAREANCDLIVAPYEQHHGSLSPYVKALFRGHVDVVAHRSRAGRTTWKRVVVPVRRASDVAHAMLDFAIRLAGGTGRVSACTCIGPREDRRQAETMLADLVEPMDGGIETRVSRSNIETFLAENATGNDLVVMGASTDRSAASRFVSRPTFERIRDLDCDVAIVDRN